MIAPFDGVAATYDATFDDHPVTRNLRSVVRGTLLRQFAPGSHVLELNCGTGSDAIALAERGVRVTAIDSSPEMISQARMKVDGRGLGTLVTCRRMDFEEVAALGTREFDGAFSNFGGLNCTPRLGLVAEVLAGAVKPRSPLVACFLNRTCLWEIAAFLARGKPSKAMRRFAHAGVDASVGGATQHVWYYSPGEIRRIFYPWFELRDAYGLSIFSPAPNARGFASAHPGLTNLLMRLDEKLRSTHLIRSLGDHFVVVGRQAGR